MSALASRAPPRCAPASTATRRSARSCRRWCCRPTSASPASTRSAGTTTRAAATRRATCSPTRWPNSKAAPAAWSPRPACRRSRWCSTRCCSRATRWSPRTTATAAAGACSTRWRARGSSNSSSPTSPIRARWPRRWRAQPALVWVETPSNPLLRITDMRSSARPRTRRARCVVVDNTFLSPALQRPHRARRRPRRALDDQVHQRPQRRRRRRGRRAQHRRRTSSSPGGPTRSGVTGAPFDSFLTLRGLRTLDARLRVHQENAQVVAALLDEHPGRARRCTARACAASGPRARAQRQQRGFGAMLSFELDGGVPAVRAFLDGLRCFTLAESLGGVESLVAHPATMTHAAMRAEARAAAGIGDGLLRLSVGIEDADDLLADLSAALERAHAVVRAAAPRDRDVSVRIALLGTGQVGARACWRGWRARTRPARSVPCREHALDAEARFERRGGRGRRHRERCRRRAPCRMARARTARRHREQARPGRGARALAGDRRGLRRERRALRRQRDGRRGLPLLRSLRALRAGGDAHPRHRGRAVGFAGVAARRATTATRPFSALVRRAQARGYMEPDPRVDLSGEDVRRKLLILVRAAGVALDADDIALEGVTTPRLLAAATPRRHRARAAVAGCGDARPLRRRASAQHAPAPRRALGRRGARVGLEALPADDPLAGGPGHRQPRGAALGALSRGRW